MWPPFLNSDIGLPDVFPAYGQALPEIVPLPLLKVQTLVPQFACVAVNKNVLVPAAENKATPVVALKPGTVGVAPPCHAEEDALYID